QKNGKNTMIAPQATARVMSQRMCTCLSVRPVREGMAADAAMELMPSILDGLAEESPLQQGHHHQRDEDEDRHDGRFTEAEEFEGGVVKQHDDGLARAPGSALGRGVHLVEDLEIEDELEDADHDDLRVEH